MDHSVLAALSDIKEFIIWCKRREEDNLAGFNVCVSKTMGKSYVLAKTHDSLKAKYVLPIWLDYADPVTKALISNAMSEGVSGKSLTAEAMENEMVCKSD